jgi:two-component system, NtrC family, response regulator AtoC
VADLGPSRGELPFRTGVAEGVSLKQAARKAAREAERELILKALTRTRWNRKRAALELQISYKALLYKLKQVGLDNPATLQD